MSANVLTPAPSASADRAGRFRYGPKREFSNSGYVCAAIHAHNVKPFATLWPLAKNGKPIAFNRCEDSLRLLVPSGNYVLLKRFSAKEEKRRLTAGCLLRAQTPFSHVAIENHVNYIYHAERELTEDEVYGIAALFNSTLIDRYFRTVSGNTQVNATEIRAMNFPELESLGAIGRRVRRNTTEAERIVLEALRKTMPRTRAKRSGVGQSINSSKRGSLTETPMTPRVRPTAATTAIR